MAKIKSNETARRRTFFREWREFRSLTQEQLAERLDVSVGLISQLENRKVNYTQATLEALAQALNCEPADLLIRDPSDPEGIWSIWDHAKKGERQQIVELAKVVTSRQTQ